MIHIYFAQELVQAIQEDKLREIKNAQIANNAKPTPSNFARQGFTKVACRIGLISTC
jgi:hypothetical protein